MDEYKWLMWTVYLAGYKHESLVRKADKFCTENANTCIGQLGWAAALICWQMYD